jgi:hypothetical protein
MLPRGLRNTLALRAFAGRAPAARHHRGTHLRDADEAELTAIVAAVRREGNPALYLNH